MSSLHFAVECGPGGCRVLDRQSSNGTFLNESRIHEALVASGDKIRAGQSTFVVQFQRAGMGAGTPAPLRAPAAPQPPFTPPAPPSYTPSAPAPPAAPSYAPPKQPRHRLSRRLLCLRRRRHRR